MRQRRWHQFSLVVAAIMGVTLGSVFGTGEATIVAVARAPRMTWLQSTAVLSWPIAVGASQASSYSYRAYFTPSAGSTGLSATTSTLSNLACVAATAGGGSVCTATVDTLPTDGRYDIQITASKTVGSTTKESPKSAALIGQDIIAPPPTPGAPTSCDGCAPTPTPMTISLVTPGANDTISGIADVLFETTGAVARAEVTVRDAMAAFICTCPATQVAGAATSAQRWRVQLDTPQTVNASYQLEALAFDLSGTSISTGTRLVQILN